MHLAAAIAATEFPPVTIFGLPLHPLVVHVVVVLLPLAALGALVMAAWPKFSVRFGPVIVAVAWVAVGGALAASHTGEQLQAKLGLQSPTMTTHKNMGGQAKFVAFGFAVIVTILWFLDRRTKGKKRGAAEWVFAVLTILAALFSIFWIVQVGHSGAELVWTTIGKAIGG